MLRIKKKAYIFQVKEQTDMTWTDTERIGAYILKLREHTDKLARQNNMLASYHKQVENNMIALYLNQILCFIHKQLEQNILLHTINRQNRWVKVLF